jgi:hypothetical protein
MQSMSPGLFRPNNRRIGGIVAQVTIEEREHDELVITEHPVEQGAHINDHAYKRPAEVTIKAGWSASGAGDLSANGNGVYGWLLNLQASLRPFDLYTGKRVYHDMLIQSLIVTTDSKSEFALMADITCRQIIIVRTQTAQPSISDDTKNQTEPEKTGTSDNKGTKEPRDVGSGDTDLTAGGGPTSGDTDLAAGGGTGSGDADLQSGGGTPETSFNATPEGAKVEAMVIKNTDSTMTVIEKGAIGASFGPGL